MKNLEFYQFLTQVFFSATVTIFCMVKLSIPVGKGKVNESLYSSILTGIVGYWLPSPTSKRSQSNVSVDTEVTTINTTDN